MLHTFEAAALTGQKTSKSPAQRGFSGVWVRTDVKGKGVCKGLPHTGKRWQAYNEGGVN